VDRIYLAQGRVSWRFLVNTIICEFLVSWIVVPCIMVLGCQRFGGICCLHSQVHHHNIPLRSLKCQTHLDRASDCNFLKNDSAPFLVLKIW
jgi:hypothetical protein